ncbi:thiamine pyrophosphate-binding protein [Frankia sp. CcI49]|uniref:thiamine pyrophosphate-dependent enzyme n=1 Tax=unclassified Frankia TaxID=2632575 RepID=UPI0006CA1646|nr:MULTISPECIES: thiamine pyrophosphate-dependent enzyme [unclassified Frankia]KPM54454.1 thiamine pyrophosphate-binding protein [Frankia sp. R43]ONH61771.1 thiamine pyrophosphate-binding protein [Frankia sp. CcI49]
MTDLTDEKDRKDGGEAILEACRSLGVDVIFSSPGSEWAPVWEALARQEKNGTPGPRYLDLLHETLAVAMATGYGLVTGRPQMVLLHAVPGLLQGACGIHGALLANVAMVVCSSESITYGETETDPGSQWYRNLSIVGGTQAVAAPFVKWSTQVGSVSTLYGSVVRAAEIARRGPAGPVYLNVPVEVLLEPWEPAATAVRPVALPGSRVSTEPELAEAARRLVAAERPVIVTESAGRHPDGFAALVDLAELLSIPVVEPQSAVCANFPRTSELHRGGEGGALFAEADLIVLVCCRAPWYPPSNRPADAEVLVIDDVPHRPYSDYQVLTADQYLEGDVGPTLRALVSGVLELGVDDERVAARRAALAAPRPARAAAGAGLDAAAVVRELRDLIDPRAAVVDETITHSRAIAQHLRAEEPGRYSYVQGGLGQGLGVALGVKLADPDREVVLTIGDGSFLYNPIVQSLAASRALGLPLLVVVFNNRQYRSMKLNHLRFYPQGTAVTEDDFRGVDLTDQPDLASLVTPFEMAGHTVTRPEELRPVLEAALAGVRAGVTALVDVHLPL